VKREKARDVHRSVDFMQDKRKYKRYNLDLLDINGKMSLTDTVEVLDISLGGVALRADRRLNMGKEYSMKLQKKGKTLEVRGVVVRSELSGVEERGHGESVSIYTAGLVFKDGFTDKIADFLGPIEQNEKIKSPAVVNRRLNVRFSITTPGQHVLSYPLQFKVRSISLGGMRIRTQQPVEINSTIPMDLSLNAEGAITFLGRAVSCSMIENAGQTDYDIGTEFIDLTDKDKTLLKTFIDYLASMEGGQKG
jgi:c-di-GMP-binding flagellar brake protein YcgR